MTELIQVDMCLSVSKLVLTYKVQNGKKVEYKAILNREDAMEVASALGWSGPVGEINSLTERSNVKADADVAA